MSQQKKNISFYISLLIIIMFRLCPAVGPFTSEGITAIGLVVAMVWLIATEAVPTGVMAFMAIVLQPILGLTSSLAETASIWTSYLFFFVILAFAIGVAFQNTTLAKRVLCFMLKRFKNDGRGPILAILLTTAILSGIIANFAIAALMLAFCWEYIELFDGHPEQRKVAACTLIGMCCATELGGNISPLGSSINMLVISTAESYGHVITFAKWVAFSLPLFIILFTLMAVILFVVFKPSPIDNEKLESYIEKYSIKKKLTREEIILIADVLLLIILFLLSPAFPWLKTEILVCIAGLVLMIPVLGVAEYDQLAKSEAFTQTVYICTFIGLATILQKTGVVTVITNAFQAALPAEPALWLIVGLLCVIVILLCNILPAAAVPSVLAAPMIIIADSLGYDPAFLLIPMAMCSNCSWILPLDPIALITFGKGYYKITDMVKVGLILTLVTAVVTGAWVMIFQIF